MENDLKKLILSKFRSVSAFAAECGIPYTTVVTILNKGVQGAGVQTVSKMCDALKIDIEALAEGRIEEKKPELHIDDPELKEELEILQINPNLKVLVKAGEKLSKEDIDFLTEMIEKMSK